MPVALDTLVDTVMLEILDVPRSVAVNALRNSAIDLCRRSGVWRGVQDTVPYQAGVGRYVLAPPAEAVVLRTTRLTLDGVRHVFPAPFEVTPPGWQTNSGGVTLFVETLPGVVDLLNVPETAGELTYNITCAPAFDAVTVPDVVSDHHLETIVDGAMWRLYAMGRKPWASANDAAYRQIRFAAGVNRARVDVNKAGAAELRVQPREFL